MMYENDKLNIPEKYRQMTVSELRNEREKIYLQSRKKANSQLKQVAVKKEAVVFKF